MTTAGEGEFSKACAFILYSVKGKSDFFSIHELNEDYGSSGYFECHSANSCLCFPKTSYQIFLGSIQILLSSMSRQKKYVVS